MMWSTSPREPRLQSEYVTSAIIAMIQSRYNQLCVATSQYSRLGFSSLCWVVFQESYGSCLFNCSTEQDHVPSAQPEKAPPGRQSDPDIL